MRKMKFVIANYDCDRILEDVAKNTTALLADCVEQLSKESGCKARLDLTVTKIETCLKILKFIREEKKCIRVTK